MRESFLLVASLSLYGLILWQPMSRKNEFKTINEKRFPCQTKQTNKKKKYRLRGRSSETAKAHRG
eukprot:TRINITY_DN2390_c0_g1_i1.p2 TRINITY_DN2390_c0_g1~~TRINITY_DN2390_c0_g1_i1.p2  ORF type:complete len:65 (+),score=28.18 TRINITY_DN2390_c0_g1_i1:219-413(+)